MTLESLTTTTTTTMTDNSRRETVLGPAGVKLVPFGLARAQSDRVIRIILPVATASGADTMRSRLRSQRV